MRFLEIDEKLVHGCIANRKNFSNSFAKELSGFSGKVLKKIRKKLFREITTFGQNPYKNGEQMER